MQTVGPLTSEREALMRDNTTLNYRYTSPSRIYRQRFTAANQPNFSTRSRSANNESSEDIDILLPVTFYFNPSTRLDNV